MRHLLILFFLILVSKASISQLNGTYTIGGTNPDYATIADAFNALNASGISGPVVFAIRDGIYNQQSSLNAITGSGAVNTVLFVSESGDSTAVVWTFTPGSSANYTCRLNGADYVSFNKITFRSIGSSFARSLVIENG